MDVDVDVDVDVLFVIFMFNNLEKMHFIFMAIFFYSLCFSEIFSNSFFPALLFFLVSTFLRLE